MPGIPTKFIIAELVLERLASDKQLPPDLMDKANLPFFYLGAIGASFGDLISARPEIGAVNPNSAYFQDWLPILQMFAGTPGTPGVYRNLKKLRDILTALNNIINSAIKGNAAEKDLAKFALLDMLDEVNSLPDLNAALTDTINSLTTLRTTIGMNILKGGPSPKSGPKQSWQVRDTLHQSQTGRFLDTLYKTATNSQQRAYALGASVGYSADLCGNPYINSIVGGPYRNDWWRHRWISNYVDTWVYGFYRQGGAKAVFIDPANVRVPNPLYTNWPNVLEANLQAKIELPGLSPNSILDNIAAVQPVTGVLPQDFVDYWIQAYTTTYGSPDSRINTEGIQSAYAMTWLILWIQTSGDVFPCIPPDQVNYPDNCGSRPNWVPVDGSIAVNDGTVVHPPQPERDTDPSVAEVISGMLLALVAAATIGGAGLLAGLEALVSSVTLIADGLTDPDWDELHCTVGWSLAYKQNFTNIMHDLLTWGGFTFPYTLALAHNDILYAQSDRTAIVLPDAALATVRSLGPDSRYPASKWAATSSNWANYPTESREENAAIAYPCNPTWPFHFVDGWQPTAPPVPPPGAPPGPVAGAPIPVNGLFSLPGRPPLVRDSVEFALRQSQLNFPLAGVHFFGNAVEVGRELIVNVTSNESWDMDPDFLNWDLDGDPGIEFPTWVEPSPSSPRTASTPEP